MLWIAWWAALTLVGAAGAIAAVNNVRFGRRVAREARELFSSPEPLRDPAPAAAIPAPVRRYVAKALAERREPIRAVRLSHGGAFRPSLDGSWLPIRGEQYFTASPPGFVWWGRVRVAPGVWIDACDRSVRGVGNMFVSAESTVTLADSRGAELDQGALMRLLGEMFWFPSALVDARYVRWTPIDDRRARATLAVGGRAATGVFTFGDDDLPAEFTADRHRDVGGGRSILTPFVGRGLDYRRVDGVLVPHRVTGAWVIDGAPRDYVDFRIERLEFDRDDAF